MQFFMFTIQQAVIYGIPQYTLSADLCLSCNNTSEDKRENLTAISRTVNGEEGSKDYPQGCTPFNMKKGRLFYTMEIIET